MRNFFMTILKVFFCITMWQCKTSQSIYPNPAAVGFDTANSDYRAITIADEVMIANGGRKIWDETRYLHWNFFGNRTLLWDKHLGVVRIDFLKKPLKIIVHLEEGSGKVLLNGMEQTHPDSLSKYLEMGKNIWINDAYWLFMPFKLKDSGVTLKYYGDATTEQNEAADLLQLSFKGVGVTPDNKYLVWVDKTTRRVVQWAYFEKFLDTEPKLINPWTDYQNYNGLWLSSGRGKRQLTDIRVYRKINADVFE